MNANESRPASGAAIEPTPIVGAPSDKDRPAHKPRSRSVFTDIELLLAVTIGLQIVLCGLLLADLTTGADIHRLALTVVARVSEVAP